MNVNPLQGVSPDNKSEEDLNSTRAARNLHLANATVIHEGDSNVNPSQDVSPDNPHLTNARRGTFLDERERSLWPQRVKWLRQLDETRKPSQGPPPSGGPFKTFVVNDGPDERERWPIGRDSGLRSQPEQYASILLQPDTRSITAEQLVNEVKGIYSGLVMVEKKCVEIIAQRDSKRGKLSNDQWQALIALHRTLLHEHYDFFVGGSAVSVLP